MECANPSRLAHDISFKGDVRHGYKQNKQSAETGNEGDVTIAVIEFLAEAVVGVITYARDVGEVTFAFGGKAGERSVVADTEECVVAFTEKRVIAWESTKRRIR